MAQEAFILYVMKQVFSLVLYGLIIIVCLFAIKKKSSRLYAASKPFLMPLLLVVYICFLPEGARGRSYQKFVAFALLFDTLGDVLLLFPRNKSRHMFYLGMLSFFTGHIFYCLWFANVPIPHSKQCAIVAFMMCFLIEYLLYRQLILGPRKYAPLLLPYSFGLCAVAVAIASTMGQGGPLFASVLSFLGIGLFFFSDFCIMRRMVRLPLFGQMMVMSTYIAGQSLIVLGMLLMQV